jgi:cytochrome P450
MTTAAAELRLADPDTFAGGPPHEAFAELRRTQPVLWQDMDGEPGFYAVLRHADVLTVSHEPNLYSSSLGGIMLEDPPAESLAMSRDMLVGMDPPRHGGYRRPVIPCFKPRSVGQLEEQIRQLCRDIMAETRELGPEVEFVHDVSAKLPTRVMGRLMGLPEQDWPYVHRISEQMLAGQDPDITSDESDRHSIMELFAYAMQFAADRRARPEQGDVTDVLLTEEFDGRRMTDADFASFFCQLVGAGNDTTKTLTAAGVVALCEHPDQLAALRADRALIGGAVEEMLRYANPVHYTRRTTSADTELSGVPIPAGAKVGLFFTSANRDETVFTDPQAFDIRRSPNRHLTFGFAEHFCLGAHLARLEARLFFEELLLAYPDFELAGEPVRLRSNFTNGHRQVPVRLWS